MVYKVLGLGVWLDSGLGTESLASQKHAHDVCGVPRKPMLLVDGSRNVIWVRPDFRECSPKADAAGLPSHTPSTPKALNKH